MDPDAPMEPSKVLVLGTACGYDEPLLRPFLRSTLRAMPSARIVLFVHDAIEGYPDRVESHVIDDQPVRRLMQALPPGQHPRACRWSQRIGRLLAGSDVRNRCRSRLITACYHYAIARYFWYLDYVERRASDGFTHAILSDTRDLVIQRNPFDSEAACSRLACGEEPSLLGECSVNRSWYRAVYGVDELTRQSGKHALCSGFTMGPIALVREYLTVLCEHMLGLGPRMFIYSGIDQAAHNHILYTTSIGPKFVFEKVTGARIATISAMGVSGLRVDPEGMVRGADGTIIAVVHQYDRHAELKAAIEAVYRDVQIS